MLFAAFFLIGDIIWRRNEYRRLGMEWVTAPMVKRYQHARLKGFELPEFFAYNMIGCEEFEVRPSDIWVSTYPKSGTSWMLEITHLLANDVDFENAQSATLDTRTPFLESPTPGKDVIDEYPSPRVIKTHLPFVLLPRGVREGKCKIIYVMRNPKDVIVSLHHFMKAFAATGYHGTVLDCAEFFLDGRTMYGPYWKHLQQYWELRNQPNVFITTYERMQKDLPGTVRAVAAFLDKKVTDEQVKQVAKWCSFSEMKQNPMANGGWYRTNILLRMSADFMRKGIVGDWKGSLTEEIAKRVDAMEERELRPFGITFDVKDAAENFDS